MRWSNLPQAPCCRCAQHPHASCARPPQLACSSLICHGNTFTKSLEENQHPIIGYLFQFFLSLLQANILLIFNAHAWLLSKREEKKTHAELLTIHSGPWHVLGRSRLWLRGPSAARASFLSSGTAAASVLSSETSFLFLRKKKKN